MTGLCELRVGRRDVLDWTTYWTMSPKVYIGMIAGEWLGRSTLRNGEESWEEGGITGEKRGFKDQLDQREGGNSDLTS